MANITVTETSEQIIGSYEIDNGAIVSIKAGCAGDYADMIASQLKALAHVVNGYDFDENWCAEIRSNVRWLLTNLTQEMAGLVSVLGNDAVRDTLERQAKATAKAAKAARDAAEPPPNPLSKERIQALKEFMEQLMRDQDAEIALA